MEITSVRIRLVGDQGKKVRGYADVTLDGCFVVRDLRIISGLSGLFLAMPYRQLAFHCQRCGTNNQRRASYCNSCGTRLEAPPAEVEGSGRAKLFADIAHPITSDCRAYFEQVVIEAYHHQQVGANGEGEPSQPQPGFTGWGDRGTFDG